MIKIGSRRVRVLSGVVRVSGAGGMRKTIGVRFSQIRLVGAGLEPEKGLAGRAANGPPSAPSRCRPTEPVLNPEELLHV